MKKILFLLLVTISSYAQTYQNPTFGNTTTNTLKIKTPATVTSVNFLPAFDADGITVSKIDPVNLIGLNNVDVVYVESNGNNSTAQIGNSKKAFLTIDAALDALPSSGGVVKIGMGSFRSPTPSKIKSNTSFIGSKEPVINSTVAIPAPNTRPTITAPTALINGTILTGEFSSLDKNNIKVSNLGIDVGKTWVDTFNAGVPVGGLVIASITASAPVKNIQVNNVTVLGYAPATAQHCMLFENIIDSKFNNLTTYYHVHGIALKGLNITMDGLNLHSHNNDGLIIKSDIYAPTRDISVNNVNINSLSGYDGGGIILEEGVNGSSLLERVSLNNVNLKYVKFGLNNVNKVSSVNISNFNLYDSNTFGIKFDNNVDKINLSGLNIVKTSTDAIDVSITGSEVVNIVNSSISDATGIGYKLTTAGNALINLVNSNTLNTTVSYSITGSGVYGISNFGTGTTAGYIKLNNPFVRSDGRIFSTNDANFGDLASTNGTLDLNFSNSAQKGTIESYNFATALPKPLDIKSSDLLISALSGTGTRQVVADASGNLSATDISPTSGTYTPTLTAGANCSSLSLYGATYTRTGNIINVTVGFSLVVTAANTKTDFTITLPTNRIATTVQNVGSGTITHTLVSTASYCAASVVIPVSVTNEVTCTFYPTSITGISAYTGSVTFQYSL